MFEESHFLQLLFWHEIETLVASYAYSAEPGRKAPYSNDLHWRVVWQRRAKQK